MTYFYEQLGPDRFQEFCQAILAVAFPDVQCLPVGQPDGGRDAYVRLRDDGIDRKIIGFQVKYVRDPQKWTREEKLEEWISRELPKIEKLKSWGVSQYILITNLVGTSHFGVGSIDKVDEFLASALSVQAQCWWRDDLDRRIDATSDIKWSYPEILRGTDVLQQLLKVLIQNNDRALVAVRAFMADQYDDDREVRFKQVELQNNLLHLFVDVPLHAAASRETMPLGVRWSDETSLTEFDYAYTWHSHRDVKCAKWLLNAETKPPFIVLEGAPGQGKSTITQFICQVHRMRLLEYNDAIADVDEVYLATKARIPVRVDLRDFATWLEGRNPFELDSREHPDTSTLEAFLAALIRYASGGHSFTIGDLTALAQASELLIVLDGFDEVADIPTRRRVVDEVTRAARRLQAAAKSINIIVTSRPAAFANSPGFPEKDWPHLELASLTRTDIETYSEKWMEARQLDRKDQESLKKTLSEKLNQPHMRDLARNPMQLAILLALIHSKGPSLPEKRTALYDKYVELFMSREAEKSAIIKQYQDIIIDFHRLLAWITHARAERNAQGGAIPERTLRSLIRSYLEVEGHDSAIVDQLFTGMVERVFMLVSRVQGTFEFEVQPLREYFAARHLYETAPYSPPGSEQSGTKPERFDAIARNFFWLNVTRFYCGCYSRGELSALSDGLEELGQESGYSSISFPRRLSTLLLSDWVFAQQPNLVRKVVGFLLESKGFRVFLSFIYSPRNRVEIALPARSGREDVRAALQEKLKKARTIDTRASLALGVIQNSSPEERERFWIDQQTDSGQDLTKWLDLGEELGLFRSLSSERIQSLVAEIEDQAIGHIFRAERMDVICVSEQWMLRALRHALDNAFAWQEQVFFQGTAASAQRLMTILLGALRVGSYSNFARWNRYLDVFDWRPAVASVGGPLGVEIGQFLAALSQLTRTSEKAWASSVAPWSTLVESARQLWGEKWTIICLAVMAAGIRSRSDKGEECDLLDESFPLCERTRFARLKSGDSSWWSQQLTKERIAPTAGLALLAVSTWGSPKALMELGDVLGRRLDALGEKEWTKLVVAIIQIRGFTEQKSFRFEAAKAYAALRRSSPRVAYVISLRLAVRSRQAIFRNCFATYTGPDSLILQEKLKHTIDAAINRSELWAKALDMVENCYKKGLVPEYFPEIEADKNPLNLNQSAIERVLENPDKFPLLIIGAAERVVSTATASKARPLAAVARDGKWFDDATLSLLSERGREALS